MPLWDNYCLCQLNKLPEFLEWKKAGIVFLYQLYEGDALLPFNILKERYQLLNNIFYQYLQIRHTLPSQTSKFQLQYNPSNILSKAISTSCTKRRLIGDLYSVLQIANRTRRQVNSFTCWQSDIESLDEGEWARALEALPEVSLSPSQRLTLILILLLILLSAHYTPQKLYAWGKALTPLCPHCALSNGSLVHMLW